MLNKTLLWLNRDNRQSDGDHERFQALAVQLIVKKTPKFDIYKSNVYK